MLTDPQIIANESVTRLHHPKHGSYLVPNNPIRFEAANTGPRRYAPGLGEHSREILDEVGFSSDDIDRLIAEGVVGHVDRETQRYESTELKNT